MKSPQTTADLLVAALVRLRSSVLAFVSVSREVQLLCAPGIDESDARILMKRVAVAFMVECADLHDVLVRNRVREVADGPLIGRFLVAPVRNDEEKLLGIMIAFKDPGETEFGERESRLAARWSRLLATSMSNAADALTGLLLPAGFERQVMPHLTTSHGKQAGAILYGNIDQLSLANELWGLDTGDKILRAVSKQLSKIHAERPDAVVGRLTGDRFAVFIPDCTLTDARQLANVMRASVAGIRIATAVEPISPRISWGVATVRPGKLGLAHSLAAAEAVCKSARSLGGDRTEIHQDGELGTMRRRDELMIVNRLRAALDAGRFEVLGQPINSLLKQEDERRFEMLVRIMDEDNKLIAPAQFMQAATRYQMLPKLDRCVINHVLTRMKDAATRPGFIPMRASFNLSAPTISDATFVDWLCAQIEDSGVPGKWLTFELSESAAQSNSAHTKLLMERLGATGCRFALDNFGAGASPLGILRALNFSSIKIDSSLVRDLLTDARAESMIKGIASLANSLGLETVAEHVETPVLCMRLIELQVHFGQGYAIGRPTRLESILNPLMATQTLARAG